MMRELCKTFKMRGEKWILQFKQNRTLILRPKNFIKKYKIYLIMESKIVVNHLNSPSKLNQNFILKYDIAAYLLMIVFNDISQFLKSK